MITHSYSPIEILEDRIAPAGVVTVVESTPGELTLTGDGVDNQVSIFQTVSGSFRIEGLTGTTLNPGGVLSLDFTKLTKLTFLGNDGNDSLTIANVDTLKSLFVDGGVGSDTVTSVNLGVKGTAEFQGGDGFDFVNFDGLTTNLTGDLKLGDTLAGLNINLGAETTKIGGSIIVTGGTGPEFLGGGGPGTLNVGKGINFDAGTAGNGSISLQFQGSQTIGKLATGESLLFKLNADSGGATFGTGETILTGGVRVMGAGGADALTINNPSRDIKIGKLTTGQSILFDGAAGPDSIFLSGANITTAGGIEFNGGDGTGSLTVNSTNGKTTLGKLSGGQSIKYTGGVDADTISMDASILKLSGGVEVTAGDGTNSFTLNSPNGAATFGKLPSGASLKYVGAAGTDGVVLTNAALVFSGGIDFAGGDGANTITVNNANGSFKLGKLSTGASIKYVGGTGADTITTADSLLTLAGGLDFSGGAGGGTVTFGGPNGKFTLGKLSTGQSVKYAGGTDSDTFTTNFATTVLAGGIEFTGDDGSNTVTFSGNGGVVNIGKLASGQSVLFTGGGGGDALSSLQAAITLAAGIEFTGGNGSNGVNFDGSGKIRIGTISTGQSLKYTGGNDADTVFVGGAAVDFKGSLEMNGDAGGNALDLDGTSTKIGKTATGVSVLLNGGVDADTIDFENNLTIAGSITLTGGDGSNLLDLTGGDQLKVSGPIAFTGGAGNDNFRIDTFALALAQSVTFTGGAGTDDFSIVANGTIGGDVMADVGGATAGSQDLTLTSHNGLVNGLVLKGKLTLTGTGANTSTDTLTMTNVSVAKALIASLGAGVSTVNIDNLFAGDLFTLTTGDGADVVNIERGNFFGNSIITKLATIMTGNDADILNIGDATPVPGAGFPDSTRVRFLGGLTADGGAGVDVANNIAGENDFPGGPPTITSF